MTTMSPSLASSGEDPPDIGPKGGPLTIENYQRDQAVQAQSGDEGRGLLVPTRNVDPKPLAFRRSSVTAGHVGRGPGSSINTSMLGLNSPALPKTAPISVASAI